MVKFKLQLMQTVIVNVFIFLLTGHLCLIKVYDYQQVDLYFSFIDLFVGLTLQIDLIIRY